MRCAPRIYVAGPISQGDQAVNVRRAIDAGERLRLWGFAPFVPHLCWFWHVVHSVPYEEWLAFDFEWLSACDALLRLPGESPGADREVAEARSLGLPVFHSIDEAITWRRGWVRGVSP